MGAFSPQLFALLSSLVEEHAGLHYAPEDAGVFADKVRTRMSEAGFESPLDYYYFLRYDPGGTVELHALVEALVVGETYFFRELDALEAAIDWVVRPAIEARGRARIWSAGCATGEEPYTLAMLADARGLLDRCEIVATDISTRELARAREGLYGSRSLRSLVPDADRWLTREDGSAVVDPRIRRAVDLRVVNLVDDTDVRAMAADGGFDLVMCRNVLIYFADDTVRKVVLGLGSALAEDGRLLVGTSESLLRFGTMLRCEERGGAFFYGRSSERDPSSGGRAS